MQYRPRFEALEPRHLLAMDPVITEFMASNQSTLIDGDGETSDWIEIYNPSDQAIRLQDWYLTDRRDNLTQWTFPDVPLSGGQFLIVFASGKDKTDALGHVHTNFALSRTGEYLGLVRPDGHTIVAEFSPLYPPQLSDVSFGLPMPGPLDVPGGYFDTPTPGTANPSAHSLGPWIDSVEHQPRQPSAAESLIVSASVHASVQSVADVSLVYRVMYEDEVTVAMSDDGQGADVMAGDGQYTGVIPAAVAAAGQMLRYYVLARDDRGTLMRSPRVVDTTGHDQSPVYYGTVINDPSVSGQLPFFAWFTQNVAAASSRAGARAGVYSEGEFYDNVFVRQRGAFTNAQSQKFEFNDVQPFYVNPQLGRVAEINLNAEGNDTAFVRQPLALESNRLAGTAAPESFLMQMRLNGQFDRVGIFVEQVDEAFLERRDLDPQGALYKFVQRQNNISSGPALGDTLTGVEKKTRLDEDSSDLDELIAALNLPTAEVRKAFIFDNLNLPQIINYLAVRTVTAEGDDTAKNFYLYRDTNASGEWSIFPWDKDRSFGMPEAPLTRAQFVTHPFLGAGGNQLYDAVFEDPTAREMYLRRLRTVMDELLQPPGTTADSLFYEMRVDQLFAPAATLLNNAAVTAAETLKGFFPAQRDNLYVTHSIDRATDPTKLQTIIPEFVAGARYFVPADNALGTGWTALADPPNIDQWGTGETGIGYEQTPENFRDLIRTSVDTQAACATCTSVLVRIPFRIADPASISDLTLRMKYDDGFVAYINGVEVARRNIAGEPQFDTLAKGHLDSAAVRFENILISEHIGLLQPGDNLLAIHAANINASNSDLLILPALVSGAFGDENAAGIPHAQADSLQVQFGTFDDNPVSGNQDEEYVELLNNNDTAVDISGWQLRGGIDHRFLPGTVIPAGGRIYVSPDAKAFRLRATSPRGGLGLLVQGGYQGHLSNLGEVVQLLRPDGRVVATLQTPTTPTLAQRYLRVSEVHYHPTDAGELTEFIELTNISAGPNAVALDLTGVTITAGPSEPFVFPAGTMLQAGAHVLVVQDRTAFSLAYPGVPLNIVVGEFAGRLDNGGERIKVDDATSSTIVDFTYADHAPWPPAADGGGASLTLRTVDADPADPTHWMASAPSPGTTGSRPGDFDGDGQIGHSDIALFCAGLHSGDVRFDLDGDRVTSHDDLVFLVQSILGTQFGDANLDGDFNSTDLVQVFQFGAYEDEVPGNSTWSEGDWDCDGDFGTGDLVLAFQAGGYVAESIPNPQTKAAAVDFLFAAVDAADHRRSRFPTRSEAATRRAAP